MTETGTARSRLRRAGTGLRALWTTPFRSQTYLNLVYLALSFPLGLAYYLFVTLVASFGIALTLFVVGVVLLAGGLVGAVFLARFEARLTSLLLDVDVRFDPDPAGESTRERLRALLTSRQTLTALLYLPSKLVLGIVSFVALLTLLPMALAFVFVPLYYDEPDVQVGVFSDPPMVVDSNLYFGWDDLLVGFDGAVGVGSVAVDTLPAALVVSAFGVGLLVIALFALNLLARFSGWYAQLLLDRSGDDPEDLGRAL